jgi:DNA-binding CsgD family transcriptional regulator
MRACAEAGAGRPPPGACDQVRLREDLEQRAGSTGRPGPVHEAWAVTFAAEAARAADRRDLAGWDAAASAWAALAQPEKEAYALLHAARAASAGGDRDGAAARLDRAAGLAGRLGADPLLGQVSSLARRARIDLPSQPGQPAQPGAAAPSGLTERELEVLHLVAAGRSNRDIAAELFIAPKTASVHVSNILGKLGVSSRGEAAATARRQHLLDGG